jgi:conjugative transfer signal peptidase TraF
MRGQRYSQVVEQDKGLRRSRRNCPPGRAESSATLKSSYSAGLVRRWPLIASLICTATAWTAHAVGLRLNASPSLPRGIYRTVTTLAVRDTLVAVCLPADLAQVAREVGYLGPGDCPGGVQAAIKRVVAVLGDVVDVAPRRVTVNDRPVPDSATAARDSSGRVLSHVPWGRRVVLAGEVWLLATHDPRSWDSRYFGALNAVQVRATLQPVLTFD